MSALYRSVDCKTDCRTLDFETSEYQNCLPASPLRGFYENSPHPLSSLTNHPSIVRSAGRYPSTEFESLPALPEAFPPEKRVYKVGAFQQHAVTSTPRSRSGIAYDSSSLKESKTTSESSPKDDPKAPISAQKRTRRSFRLGKKVMGSGSSVDRVTSGKKGSKKSSSKPIDSSDNGGFDSGSPKPVLGVKEKLRYSLDKISLKSPFRWGSSDKLTHNAAKGVKAKSKNIRRYSDSSSAFLSTESGAIEKRGQQTRNAASESAPRSRNTTGLSRMIRAYPAARRDSIESELVFGLKSSAPSDHHDYVNLADEAKSQQQQFDSNPSQHLAAGNDYSSTRNPNYYHDVSTLSRLQEIKSKETGSRAKGTWKMLKSNQSSYASQPVKAESNSYNTESEYHQADTEFMPEHDGCVYDVVVGDISSMEPPKLAPVSGKLLLDKSSEKVIVKPTAFRPTPVSNHNSPLLLHFSEQSPWRQEQRSDNDDEIDRVEADHSRKSSRASNHSDSGRHSSTSIPPDVAETGSFSCSGSEGYESARISSSTNHSAVHDHETNFVDASSAISPRKPSDRTRSVASAIAEKHDLCEAKHDELESSRRELRHLVIAESPSNQDREASYSESPSQMKLQRRRSSSRDRHQAELNYRRLHEEQKQLHDANNELEERIKSMTQAIDEQTKQRDDVDELRTRLDENEAEMQQHRGEISMLKRQLKEKQGELSQRAHELLAVKSYNRDLRAEATRRDADNRSLLAQLNEQRHQIVELERRLAAASSYGNSVENRSLSASRSANGFFPFDAVRSKRLQMDSRSPQLHSARDIQHFASQSPANSYEPEEKDAVHQQLHHAEHRLAAREREFEREKQQWADDKSKVIKYQKLLQENYVQMYKRSNALERQVKSLTAHLQRSDLSATTEPPFSEAEERPSMCYPMEI